MIILVEGNIYRIPAFPKRSEKQPKGFTCPLNILMGYIALKLILKALSQSFKSGDRLDGLL